jgi:hypothetical protein
MSTRTLRLKEDWKSPPGAIARPKTLGRPDILVLGMERVRFVCGRCRREVDYYMPERGPHRETPKIDYFDDPLKVPACPHHELPVLMNARHPWWDLEIRTRYEELAMRHEAGHDVSSSPTLIVDVVPTVETYQGRMG